MLQLRFLLLLTVACATVAQAQAPPDRVRLTLDKAADGQLSLAWQDSCALGATDYALYEGSVGNFADHAAVQCSTGGAASAVISPAPGSGYFLVVPQENGSEGSYGLSSVATERPVGSGVCQQQQTVRVCLDDNFVDADSLRLARLDQVIDAATAILTGGGSYTDVANMLATQTDVDSVSSNGVSLFFRVGGLSSSLYDAAVARHGAPLREIIAPAGRANPASRGSSGLASEPVPAPEVASLLPRGQRVVGIDDNGDGFRDLPKHALILSPYAFDFAIDSAREIENLLTGVLDYQIGSVTYKENANDLSIDSLTLSDYIDDWTDQDILFVSSHGDADPDAPWGPEPLVFLGIGGTSCAELAARIQLEIPDPALRPGLGCHTPVNLSAGNPGTRDVVALTEFWEFVHGGRLHKKLIWMDACRTAAHPGLAEALTGTDSIYFGWSDYVRTSVSADSSSAVIGDSAQAAFPALRSFVRSCANGECMDPPGDETPAELLAAWNRADLRTREGLNLLSSPVQGFCGVSPSQPVSLTCPSCGGGFPLSLSYNIGVEGMEPQDIAFLQDPLEFAKYQLRLFADVDGVGSGFATPLTDLNLMPTGNGAYVDSTGITMAIDNICPFESVQYRPWVLLPAFDEGMPGNDGRDRMYSWDDPWAVQVIPTQLP